MSVDTPASEDCGRAMAWVCGTCEAPVADVDARFMAWHPTGESAAPPMAASDGIVVFCPSCASEVAELTETWGSRGQPSIESGRSIAESYRELGEDCSFCDRSIDEAPLLGIESWGRGGTEAGERGPTDVASPTDADANYVLCDDCGSIFEEFLRGVES